MMQQVKALYRRQMFFPGWIGIFVNPFYFARAGLRDAMTALAPKLTGRLLDVGCGTKPYRSLFAVDAYIGLDIDSDASRRRGIADHLYDGKAFPFADGSFDSILCNQVLEHVFNPDEFLGEIARVLKPGGSFYSPSHSYGTSTSNLTITPDIQVLVCVRFWKSRGLSLFSTRN